MHQQSSRKFIKGKHASRKIFQTSPCCFTSFALDKFHEIIGNYSCSPYQHANSSYDPWTCFTAWIINHLPLIPSSKLHELKIYQGI